MMIVSLCTFQLFCVACLEGIFAPRPQRLLVLPCLFIAGTALRAAAVPTFTVSSIKELLGFFPIYDWPSTDRPMVTPTTQGPMTTQEPRRPADRGLQLRVLDTSHWASHGTVRRFTRLF